MSRLFPFLAAALLASPAAAATVKPPVTVSDAWLREAPPGATAMAGYLTLVNKGHHPLTLHGVTSPLFASIVMHTMAQHHGMMTMQERRSFALKPGEVLTFQPGGNHLMMMGAKHEFKAGDRVPLKLDFGRDGSLSIIAPVKRPS